MISLSALHLLAAPVHVVPRDFTIPQDPTLAFQRTDTITFIVDAANNVTESVPVYAHLTMNNWDSADDFLQRTIERLPVTS